jgi:hypothetical protein
VSRKEIFIKQPLESAPGPRLGNRADIILKKKELDLLKRQERIHFGLPHLYGYKWYRWARAFFENRHKVALLTSGNQLSKSSTMIRKAINWATDKSVWKTLWPNHEKPILFWYLYPTLQVATTEFETKWLPEFMPRDEFKDDPNYGWKSYYDKQGYIKEIVFNSGVTLQFKAYSMQAVNLQTATVFARFVDEEMPMHLYDEVMFRLHGTEGYFNSVFTATLGQEFWRCAMEEIGGELETLKDAYKVQVSAYDCMYYEDGSPGPWTEGRIEAAKRKCKSEAEIQKRIYGRFVLDSGVKYETFVPSKHFVKPFAIPENFAIYAGVDIGSGGKNHPSAISFVAVAPNMRAGFIFKGWRGDGVVTTADDVLTKYKEMAEGHAVVLRQADPRATDFHTIASRSGIPFTKAESKHEIGEGVISTLLKNEMLFIFDDPELRKLGVEFGTLRHETPKSVAKDDFIDSVRYIVPAIPWDWGIVYDKLSEKEKTKPAPPMETPLQYEIRTRRGERLKTDKAEDWEELEQEIESWNELYEG